MANSLPSGVGGPNGPKRTGSFNRWFRYPAGFGTQAVDIALDSLNLSDGRVLFDPFAGVATLAPYFSGKAIHFVGLEANPFIAEIGNLKAGAWPEPDDLEAAGQTASNVGDNDVDITQEHELVRRCFDRERLSDLVRLRTRIARHDRWARPWLRVAVAATLRDVAVASVSWPYQRPDKPRRTTVLDVAERFRERVSWMADDIRSIPSRTPGRVLVGDARLELDVSNAIGDIPIDACLTSPPYLNNYDYADATRLELYFFSFADSWSSMCRFARDAMIVASTQQTSKAAADNALEYLREQSGIGPQITKLYDRLGEERAQRNRGKEYDRLFVQYMTDMRITLYNLYQVLGAGAPACFVVGDSAPYGVHIDTPQLLGELAKSVGFEPQSEIAVRHRGRRWRSNSQRKQHDLKESVLILKRSR